MPKVSLDDCLRYGRRDGAARAAGGFYVVELHDGEFDYLPLKTPMPHDAVRLAAWAYYKGGQWRVVLIGAKP